MKNKLMDVLLIMILVLTVTGCGNAKDTNEVISKPVNNTEEENKKENDTTYSTCAKTGNTCSKEDMLEGQLVKVKLSDTKTEDFYVINDDGENVTLIMNNYIETPWISNEDIKGVCKEEKDGKSCGPYTALKKLNDYTNDWTNIDNISDYLYKVEVTDVEDHYKTLKIASGVTTLVSNSSKEYTIPGNTKARLMTTDEISEYKGTDWLRKKVADDFDAKKIKYIYILTATPSYGGYDGTVKAVTCKYKTAYTNINVDSTLALMPVITISKSKI